MDRFSAVEHFFRRTRHFNGEIAQTARGLAFVQVYGIHEYTVNNVVRITVPQIASRSHSYSDLKPTLLALFLDAEFKSARDCSVKKIWEQRLKLLERINSSVPISVLGEVPIPGDGTHYRHGHVEFILRVFGIQKSPTVRRQHLRRIDEVVDNRNLIAHGEEPAANIGKRYSRSEIHRMIRQMKSACLRLILVFEEYCNDPQFHCR